MDERALTKEIYRCSQCRLDKERVEFTEEFRSDRKRQVAYKCRGCQSNEYHATKYDQICMACLKPRRLDSNGICNRCNDDAGKRQCRKCGEMKLRYFGFYGPRRVCISCYRAKPPSEASAALPAPQQSTASSA